MTSELVHINVRLKTINVVPHPVLQEWGIQYIFECNDCHEEVTYVIEYDKEKCDAFVASIKEQKPNRLVVCLKCYPWMRKNVEQELWQKPSERK